jgi:AI-2 transport protein TqsA
MVAGLALKITVGIIAAVLAAAAFQQASTVFAPLALAIFIIAIVWPLQYRLQAQMPKQTCVSSSPALDQQF